MSARCIRAFRPLSEMGGILCWTGLSVLLVIYLRNCSDGRVPAALRVGDAFGMGVFVGCRCRVYEGEEVKLLTYTVRLDCTKKYQPCLRLVRVRGMRFGSLVKKCRDSLNGYARYAICQVVLILALLRQAGKISWKLLQKSFVFKR